MTPQRAKAYVALLLLLLGAVGVNVLLLQPPGRGREIHRVDERTPLQVPETNPTTIGAVQRELQRRGYYPGPQDGAVSLMTSAAVLGFEYDAGLPLTGAPSESVLKAIIMGEASPQGSRQNWQPEPGTAAESTVREVQRALARLGYGVGNIDGRLSEETVRAIREYEMDQDLKPSGRISGPLIAKLTAPRPARNAATKP